MNNKSSKTSSSNLQTLAIIALIGVSLGAIAKIMHWSYADVILGAGLITTVVLYFVVISDLINYQIYNKGFWAISLAILPFPTAFIYALRREKLRLD